MQFCTDELHREETLAGTCGCQKSNFFTKFFITAKNRLGANPSIIKISQCVQWMIQKDPKLDPQ